MSEIYQGLRSQFLDADPIAIGLQPTPELPHVWGALLETGYSSGVATVVSLADGTTSLYTTSGFGIIGGGGHEQVILATRQFLLTIEHFLDGFQPEADASLPAEGVTTIRALTYAGRRSATAPEEDFGRGVHPLSVAFHAEQEVIAQLRLVDEAAKQREPQ